DPRPVSPKEPPGSPWGARLPGRNLRGCAAGSLSPRTRGMPAEARQRSGSEPELREPGMVGRPRALRPAELPVLLANGHVVHARLAPPHVALGVELPLLVAVGPEPVPGVVVVLVDEAHRDAVLVEGPQLLDEPVVDLPRPLATEEGDDLLAPLEELGAVSPPAFWGLGPCDAVRARGVPGITVG